MQNQTYQKIKPAEFRKGILLAAFLYSFFAIIDPLMMPIHYKITWIVRLAIVLPTILLIVWFSYNDYFMRFARQVLLVLIVLGQIGINFMIFISENTEGGYWGYYAGLILIILWAGFIFRFTINENLFVFISTITIYNIVAIYYQRLPFFDLHTREFAVFWGNNFFLICSGIISTVGAYRLEQYQIKFFEENEKHIQARAKAEESDRLKSAFLANMSHEIRTPMNSIIGFSDLLQKQSISDEKRNRYASIITNSGEHLLRIIDDIIDISKIESGQLTINNQYFNANDLLKECIDIKHDYKKRLAKENLSLQINIQESESGKHLFSDPIRLRQIIDNLLSNAIKNTDNGFVELGYTSIIERDKTFLQFYVKDTGIGIPSDKTELIFERFRQVDTDRAMMGTGLGLSIAKGLVKLLGGRIWLESQLGVGSTFFFTIPIFQNEGLKKQNELLKTVQTTQNYSDKWLYVAEDDMDSYYLIHEILSKTGIQIKHANNGRELLELLKIKVPDMILMDINMPVMNGFDCIAAIRKEHKQLPIIVQTAYAMSNEKEICIQNGFNDYLSKPINAKELLHILASILKYK